MSRWKKILSVPVISLILGVTMVVLALWANFNPDRERIFYNIIESPFFEAFGIILFFVLVIYCIVKRINKDPK